MILNLIRLFDELKRRFSVINKKWEVSNDLWGSDHYPIFIFVEVTVRGVVHRKSRKLYTKKTDWFL